MKNISLTRSENANEQQGIFFLFDPNDELYVWDIGKHNTPPNHTFGPAIRPYYLLHLIESGKGEIERNGNITFLSAGEAFLIRPGEVTTYRADAQDPWTYRWISFYGSFAEKIVRGTTDRLCMPYRKSGAIALQTALENNISDQISALRVLFTVLDSVKLPKEREKRTDHEVIATALHYLENNYFHPIDISSLASRLGFSRAYFSTLFSKKTGETPYHYLTEVRIKKAKEYLSDNTLSVEEITYSVGFESLQRFSEMFKKYTGYSPSQYRKTLIPQ